MVRLTDDVLKCLLAPLRLCFLLSSGWFMSCCFFGLMLFGRRWRRSCELCSSFHFFSSSAPLAFPMGSSGECLRAAGLVERVDPSDQSKTSNRGDVIGLLCSCPITLQFFKGSSSLELSSLWFSPHWTFDLVCLVRRRSRLWADFSSSSSRKLWSIEVVKCRNRFCGCLEFYDVAMMLFVQKTNKQ